MKNVLQICPVMHVSYKSGHGIFQYRTFFEIQNKHKKF